jgi:uncharacterized repeat protein (TIGR03803 family)
MHTTKITRTLALAGFVPAGKLGHLYGGLLPALALFIATLGKLNWGKRAYAVLVLCAATAIALPAQTYTTLFSFDGTDGANPRAGLVQATNGDLYGTTPSGGASTNCFGGGCGNVFKITPSGTLTTLYSFCSQSGCPDGNGPFAGLIQATNGDLYGTTALGGANDTPNCSQFAFPGCGTIFKITPSGALTTLYSFCSQSGCPDGSQPEAGLVQAANGDFYGTTSRGGTSGVFGGEGGTVFKITPSGTLTTLYSFCSQLVNNVCTDGLEPFAGLVQATNGDFYGTTYAGGANNGGTIFKITPSGTLTTLYNFCSQSNCTDGAAPYAGLVQATNGEFYGTTLQGGVNSAGTVFKITPSGMLTTLHRFCRQESPCPDGVAPSALAQATDGNFYGTAAGGGANNEGTIFNITPSGTLTTLYSFCSQSGCPDGWNPNGVVQDTNGSLYGTTLFGGTSNDGVVFSLSVDLGPFVETQTTSGKVGAVVKILGTALTGATSVSFNGAAAGFTVAAPSLITATVPAGATSGTVQVVTPSGTLSSNVPFRVLP